MAKDSKDWSKKFPLFTDSASLFRESLKIFKELWKKFIGLMVIYPLYALLAMLAILLLGILVFLIFYFLKLPSIVFTIIVIVLGALLLAAIITLMVLSIIVSYGQLFFLKDRKLTIRQAFKQARSYFWRSLWVMILTSVVFGVGVLLFVVPGIIWMVWFTLSLMVLIFENVGGTAALKRSKQLVKGFWWTTLARIIFFWLVSFVFFNLINSLNYYPTQYVIRLIRNQSWTNELLIFLPVLIIYLALTFIYFAFSIIASAIYSIYYYLIYQQLKEIKERDENKKETISKIEKTAIIIITILICLYSALSFYHNMKLDTPTSSQPKNNAATVLNDLNDLTATTSVNLLSDPLINQ